MRLELFFKSIFEFQSVISLARETGVTKVNLTNKGRNEPILQYMNTLKTELPDVEVCPHFSIKYQYRRNAENTFKGFQDFCRDAKIAGAENVLLISGSGPKKELHTVNCLQRVVERGGVDLNIGVAFNPYFPNLRDLNEEKRRLEAKIRTGAVSSVWLQFGSDRQALKQGLQYLNTILSGTGIKVIGSLFIPSKKLIAQMKFRPWNGVFLSEQYLSDVPTADAITIDIVDLYRQFNVEPIVESVVKSSKDFERVKYLLGDLIENNIENEVSVPEVLSGAEQIQADPLIMPDSPARLRSGRKEKARNMRKAALLGRLGNQEQDSRATPAPRSTVSKTRQMEQQKQQKIIVGSTCIMWFRLDFRLTDNVALSKASKYGAVIPLFVREKYPEDFWSPRGAAEVWIKQSLLDLDSMLQEKGTGLVTRKAEGIDELCETFGSLIQETGATAVFLNRRYEPQGKAADEALASFLQGFGIEVYTFNSYLLYEPQLVGTPADGKWFGHFATLMPFKKCCDSRGTPPEPLPPPKVIPRPPTLPYSTPIEELELAVLPRRKNGEVIDWTVGILETWDISEKGALNLLDRFLTQRLKHYEAKRSRADLNPNSQLSPYLRFGNLSPRSLHWGWLKLGLPKEITKTFGRRLYWRDLAYYHLHCFPQMMELPVRLHYIEQRWNSNLEWLHAWQKGLTGYPMVDAGMRELWITGWMQQNVRMIAAQFLTEILNIHWIEGEKWFHDTLVDADVAINAMMWQNGGRSGLDQWNFVIDPITGSQDPTGNYVRRWLPELSKLPAQFIHKPWTAPPGVLAEAGVVLGETYPHRIIEDLDKARLDTHDAVVTMRRNNMDYNDELGYDLVDLPWGGKSRVFTKKAYRLNRNGNLMYPGARDDPEQNQSKFKKPSPKVKSVTGKKKQNSVDSLGPKQSNLEMYFPVTGIQSKKKSRRSSP